MFDGTEIWEDGTFYVYGLFSNNLDEFDTIKSNNTLEPELWLLWAENVFAELIKANELCNIRE